jgi:hypothetical protein
MFTDGQGQKRGQPLGALLGPAGDLVVILTSAQDRQQHDGQQAWQWKTHIVGSWIGHLFKIAQQTARGLDVHVNTSVQRVENEARPCRRIPQIIKSANPGE